MQPYFLPYIGYFQLIAAVDKFVVYDNVKYTKKGWINRNRMLLNGREDTFSLAIRNAPDSLNVCEREISPEFDREKLLRRLAGAYRRAPHYAIVFPTIEEIICCGESNLFNYLFQSIVKLSRYLQLKTEFEISSDIPIDHTLTGQDKVLAICNFAHAKTYVNPTGGVDLYSRTAFANCGVELKFLRSLLMEYKQFDSTFVPWLSIVDVLMFNSADAVNELLRTKYELH